MTLLAQETKVLNEHWNVPNFLGSGKYIIEVSILPNEQTYSVLQKRFVQAEKSFVVQGEINGFIEIQKEKASVNDISMEDVSYGVFPYANDEELSISLPMKNQSNRDQNISLEWTVYGYEREKGEEVVVDQIEESFFFKPGEEREIAYKGMMSDIYAAQRIVARAQYGDAQTIQSFELYEEGQQSIFLGPLSLALFPLRAGEENRITNCLDVFGQGMSGSELSFKLLLRNQKGETLFETTKEMDEESGQTIDEVFIPKKDSSNFFVDVFLYKDGEMQDMKSVHYDCEKIDAQMCTQETVVSKAKDVFANMQTGLMVFFGALALGILFFVGLRGRKMKMRVMIALFGGMVSFFGLGFSETVEASVGADRVRESYPEYELPVEQNQWDRYSLANPGSRRAGFSKAYIAPGLSPFYDRTCPGNTMQNPNTLISLNERYWVPNMDAVVLEYFAFAELSKEGQSVYIQEVNGKKNVPVGTMIRFSNSWVSEDGGNPFNYIIEESPLEISSQEIISLFPNSVTWPPPTYPIYGMYNRDQYITARDTFLANNPDVSSWSLIRNPSKNPEFMEIWQSLSFPALKGGIIKKPDVRVEYRPSSNPTIPTANLDCNQDKTECTVTSPGIIDPVVIFSPTHAGQFMVRYDGCPTRTSGEPFTLSSGARLIQLFPEVRITPYEENLRAVNMNNKPPTPPTFSGSVNLRVNEMGSYQVEGSVDSDGDAIQYQIDWTNNGISNVASLWSDGTRPFSSTKSWMTPGIKDIQARACDDSGAPEEDSCSAWIPLQVNVAESSLEIRYFDETGVCAGELFPESITNSVIGTAYDVVACEDGSDVTDDAMTVWSAENAGILSLTPMSGYYQVRVELNGVESFYAKKGLLQDQSTIESSTTTKQLILKKDSCSGTSFSQYSLDDGEDITLYACDQDTGNAVSSSWSINNTSCITTPVLSTPDTHKTFTASSGGSSCTRVISVSQLDHIGTQVTVAVDLSGGGGSPPGIDQGKASWKEVAP